VAHLADVLIEASKQRTPSRVKTQPDPPPERSIHVPGCHRAVMPGISTACVSRETPLGHMVIYRARPCPHPATSRPPSADRSTCLRPRGTPLIAAVPPYRLGAGGQPSVMKHPYQSAGWIVDPKFYRPVPRHLKTVETLVEGIRVDTLIEGRHRDLHVTVAYRFAAPDSPADSSPRPAGVIAATGVSVRGPLGARRAASGAPRRRGRARCLAVVARTAEERDERRVGDPPLPFATFSSSPSNTGSRTSGSAGFRPSPGRRRAGRWPRHPGQLGSARSPPPPPPCGRRGTARPPSGRVGTERVGVAGQAGGLAIRG
jgi:hypothetical protein